MPDWLFKDEEEVPEKKSMKDEPDEILNGKGKQKRFGGEDYSATQILKTIRKKMDVYEATGERPSILEKLYESLETLPPSSVETEQTFCTAGLFVTKVMSSLGNDTVGTLAFLQSYLHKTSIWCSNKAKKNLCMVYEVKQLVWLQHSWGGQFCNWYIDRFNHGQQSFWPPN